MKWTSSTNASPRRRENEYCISGGPAQIYRPFRLSLVLFFNDSTFLLTFVP